jgi:hypothetical protein
MALPNESFACHKTTAGGEPRPHGPNDSCDDGGSGSGGNAPQVIGVHEHDGLDLIFAPLWAPTDKLSTCVLQKNSGKSLSGAFPRHDLCASLPDNSVPIIQDDIIVIVHTSNRGEVLAVEVQGQDSIGTVGLVHISDVMVPSSVENVADGSMIIHVHADNVGLYKCDTHVLKKQSNCDALIGEFALHDLIYSSAP